MTIFARCITFAGLLSFVTLPAFADDIVGMWSSVSREPGGLGAQWTFSQNGDVIHTFGVLTDFKYEVNGTQLKLAQLHPDQSPMEAASIQDFSIEGDTLTISPRSPDQKIMKRVGKRFRGAHPIVGEWTYIHQTGNTALMKYSRAGIALLNVPFRTLTGLYDINQSTLSVTFQGKKTSLCEFRIDNFNQLTLTNAEAKESRYLKFEY